MDSPRLWETAPKQLDRTLGFFARVEAKASFLFALNSALLGALAIHVERQDLQKWPMLSALGLFGICLSVSYYFVYRCLFPNLSGGHSSLIYFREIAKLREQEFIKSYRGQTEDAHLDDLLGQVWRNSEILTAKFNAIKISFIATGLSLLPWTIFLVLASLTHLPPAATP